jgi:hypothetical protein
LRRAIGGLGERAASSASSIHVFCAMPHKSLKKGSALPASFFSSPSLFTALETAPHHPPFARHAFDHRVCAGRARCAKDFFRSLFASQVISSRPLCPWLCALSWTSPLSSYLACVPSCLFSALLSPLLSLPRAPPVQTSTSACPRPFLAQCT